MFRSSSNNDTSSTALSPASLEDNLPSQALDGVFAKSEEIRRQGKWLPDEDELLRKYVEEYGEKQWQKISKNIPGRTSIQCLHRWSKILKPGLTKGPWTAEEDLKLMAWVNKHGPTQWTKAGEQITGRSGKQCRERWFNSLNPDVKKGGWTPEEDKLIFELYQQHGSSWSKIARQLPGRSENSVKNRFYSTLRKTDLVTGLKKPEPSAIDCKRVMTDETNKSTQVTESEKKDNMSDDEMAGKKSENTLYNLLKKSYSEQKGPGDGLAAKNFVFNKPKEEKKPKKLTAGKMQTEGENQEEKSVKSDGMEPPSIDSLNLAKRYNSCKTTHNELEEFEQLHKKLFGLGGNINNLGAGLYGNPLLNNNLFGQGLGGLSMGNLLNNPLLGQFKNQENLAQGALQGLNPGLLLGLNPLSLNLQTNSLLGGNLGGFNGLSGLNGSGLQNFGNLPLQARNSNIKEEMTDEKIANRGKMNIKEEHDHSGEKNNINGLLDGQKANNNPNNNNIENLLNLSNMLYTNQLQNLMNSYGSLAARNLAGGANAGLMRQLNPLEAALNGNKNLLQQFQFPAFQ